MVQILMPIQIIDSGSVNRSITGIQVIDASGVDRTISEIRLIDTTGVDRLIYSTSPPMSASASPSATSGFTSGASVITTNSTTVTPTGGTGPYTYAWTLISRDHPTTDPTANSPTAATTTFTQTNAAPGGFYTAEFLCTVTDSLGAMATASVSASFIEVS